MVQMTLHTISDYQVSENLQKALAFYAKNEKLISTQDVGKYEIDPAFFYMIQEYETKAENKWEAHKKYIDIQIILAGYEKMDVADICHLKKLGEFDESKDFQGYEGEARSSIIMSAGDMVIFLPHDGHKPGLSVPNQPTPVKKCIFKVLY